MSGPLAAAPWPPPGVTMVIRVLAQGTGHQVGLEALPSVWPFLPLPGDLKVSVSCSLVTLCDSMDCSPPGSSVCSLLQGIFSIWGENMGLSHCRQILYCLRHQGSPGT